MFIYRLIRKTTPDKLHVESQQTGKYVDEYQNLIAALSIRLKNDLDSRECSNCELQERFNKLTREIQERFDYSDREAILLKDLFLDKLSSSNMQGSKAE